MPSREELLRRQKSLGQFGEFILDCEDLQKVLDEACRLISEALGTDLAKIIEIDRASDTGLIRAGIGWRPGIVGKERLQLSERSSESYAISTSEPVVTQDIAQEDRFEYPEFMKDHGVVAIVNVPIMLPRRVPYGLLQVDAREPRAFGDEDIEFLKTYAMTLGPVIDRLRTVGELRETDERLHLIVENARGYAIIVSDPEDRITDWLADSEEIFGWSAEDIIGKPTSVLFTKEDRDHGQPERELKDAREGGAAANVRWHCRRDGRRVFIDGQTVALRDADGKLRGYLKIGQDVTHRKLGEERQATLLAELQHRVRNVLAMIRSVIRRTADTSETVEGYHQHLEGRITAMARTQALLTRAPGAGVDLQNVILDELLAQSAGQDQFTVAGQDVELAPKAAEVLTLAIHELATNATKYGALTAPEGRIDVRWSTEKRDDQDWLMLTWTENGVQISGTPKRRGFGTELIVRRVPYELRGHGKLDLGEQGLVATIEFPLLPGESVLQTDAGRLVEAGEGR